MKAVLLIFSIFSLCYCNAQMMAASKACSAELKLQDKEVADFYSDEAKFNAATPNLQCHLKCVMEKLGHLKDGQLNVEKAMKDWKELPELADNNVKDPKVFEKCKAEKGANECETAYKIHKCLRQNKA